MENKFLFAVRESEQDTNDLYHSDYTFDNIEEAMKWLRYEIEVQNHLDAFVMVFDKDTGDVQEKLYL